MSDFIQDLVDESTRPGETGTKPQNDFLDHFVKLPDGAGAVIMRILAPAPAGTFGRDKNPLFQYTRVHKVNGRNVHCLKELSRDSKGKLRFVGDCPICDYYSWLWQESEKKDPDEAAKLQSQARLIKPIERYYYNVIVRKETDPKTGENRENVGPKILAVGKTLHSIIVDNIVGNAEKSIDKLGDVTHPKTGRDFKLIKQLKQSGKEVYPAYESSKFLEVSAVDPDLYKVWVSNLHDLVALRVVKDVPALKKELKIHLGLIPNEQTKFDPSEYQQVSETAVTEVVVQATTKQSSGASSSSTPKVDNPVPEDIGVVDEEFFKSLQGLKA